MFWETRRLFYRRQTRAGPNYILIILYNVHACVYIYRQTTRYELLLGPISHYKNNTFWINGVEIILRRVLKNIKKLMIYIFTYKYNGL